MMQIIHCFNTSFSLWWQRCDPKHWEKPCHGPRQKLQSVLFTYHWCQLLHINIEIALRHENVIVGSEFWKKHAIVLLGDQLNANAEPQLSLFKMLLSGVKLLCILVSKSMCMCNTPKYFQPDVKMPVLKTVVFGFPLTCFSTDDEQSTGWNGNTSLQAVVYLLFTTVFLCPEQFKNKSKILSSLLKVPVHA